MSQKKSTSGELGNKNKTLSKKSNQAGKASPVNNKKSESISKRTPTRSQPEGQKAPLKKFKSKSNLLRTLISNLESAKLRNVANVVDDDGVNPFGRKTRSEDPNFNAPKIPRLVDLCVEALVEHFPKHNSLLKKTPDQFQKIIINKLPTNLPISVTANTVNDESYWKKKCKERWKACDPEDHEGSWKRAYLERNLQEEIESFVPDKSNLTDLKHTIITSSNHVHKLEIFQILPMGFTQTWNATSGLSHYNVQTSDKGPNKNLQIISSIDLDDDADLDHLDFGLILPLLPNLRELHLCYSIRNCGTNFQKNYFRISENDCHTLAKCLQKCYNLEHLSITRSHLSNSGIKILTNQLKCHPNLKHLDLSHNFISDLGANTISNTLQENKFLKHLDLTNNQITALGAQALAKFLSYNSGLQSLELRLNRLGDSGCAELMKTLTADKALTYLGLAGNKAECHTVQALCEVLRSNITLTRLDLSSNILGNDNGALIHTAISENPTITSMDLRETDIGKELELLISEICDRNFEKL